MEKQGSKYVRYADDFSIYCASRSKARKAEKEVHMFLKNKLHLPVNAGKSGIRRPVQFTILGYCYVPTYQKDIKGKYQLVVSGKGWANLKQEAKQITRKTTPCCKFLRC
jgi:hypothetical protein